MLIHLIYISSVFILKKDIQKMQLFTTFMCERYQKLINQ